MSSRVLPLSSDSKFSSIALRTDKRQSAMPVSRVFPQGQHSQSSSLTRLCVLSRVFPATCNSLTQVFNSFRLAPRFCRASGSFLTRFRFAVVPLQSSADLRAYTRALLWLVGVDGVVLRHSALAFGVQQVVAGRTAEQMRWAYAESGVTVVTNGVPTSVGFAKNLSSHRDKDPITRNRVQETSVSVSASAARPESAAAQATRDDRACFLIDQRPEHQSLIRQWTFARDLGSVGQKITCGQSAAPTAALIPNRTGIRLVRHWRPPMFRRLVTPRVLHLDLNYNHHCSDMQQIERMGR